MLIPLPRRRYLDRWSVTPANRTKAVRTYAALHHDATVLSAGATPPAAFRPLCSFCGQRFDNALAATVHVATHLDACNGAEHSAPRADDAAADTPATASLTRAVVSPTHLLQCEFCLASFSSRRDFETHQYCRIRMHSFRTPSSAVRIEIHARSPSVVVTCARCLHGQ